MEYHEFVVFGEPQGKGRPRFTKVGTTYTPKKTADYEQLVKAAYRKHCKACRFDDDAMIKIEIFAYYGIPKSASAKKRAEMLTRKKRPIKKPDMDNVLKIIADSLNGLAYKDDTQIVEAVVHKYYGDVPSVLVRISSI